MHDEPLHRTPCDCLRVLGGGVCPGSHPCHYCLFIPKRFRLLMGKAAEVQSARGASGRVWCLLSWFHPLSGVPTRPYTPSLPLLLWPEVVSFSGVPLGVSHHSEIFSFLVYLALPCACLSSLLLTSQAS